MKNDDEKYRILIIDDSIDNLDLLSQLLEGEGYTVLQATNGKYGLEIANKVCPALILLDIKMPGMDGYEVCKVLKKTEGLLDIPIIFISGLDSRIDKVKAFGLGGLDYITKPFQEKEVLARIKVQIELLAARAELEQRVIKRTKELNKANQELKQKTEQLDQFFNIALDLLCITTGGKILQLNPQFEEVFGHTREELMSKSIMDFIHPDDVENTMKAFASLSSQQPIINFVTRCKCKDGSYRWIEWRSAPAGELVYSSARDITEQVLRQREIQAAKERFQSLFTMFRLIADNSDDFLWAKDLNNRYIFANKTICDRLLIAKSVDEPIGKTDIFFATREQEAHPENHEWHTFGEIGADSDLITRKEGTPQQFDEFGNVQGKFLFLDVHKAPIFDEDGNLIGVVGTARDVTQTKKLEKEKSDALELLQKSEVNLRNINVEKDKFFSIIAHDLRGPLSSFLGLTQVMMENLPNLSLNELQLITASMSKSATNLFGLLENLLEWSRIQKNTIGFNPQSITVRPKILENIQSVLESAKIKGITIELDIPEDLNVFADENMFGSTIRNFASNAVKFTHKGGEVVIASKDFPGKYVEISVRDNGIGMNQELLRNLFRLDETTNRKGTEDEPTTGLGLLLCKEFVEKQGGKIWAESEVGKGSVFYFTIPRNAFPEKIAFKST